MAIQGFCPSPPSHSPSPYYQLLERGSARLGRVKNFSLFISNVDLKEVALEV